MFILSPHTSEGPTLFFDRNFYFRLTFVYLDGKFSMSARIPSSTSRNTTHPSRSGCFPPAREHDGWLCPAGGSLGATLRTCSFFGVANRKDDRTKGGLSCGQAIRMFSTGTRTWRMALPGRWEHWSDTTRVFVFSAGKGARRWSLRVDESIGGAATRTCSF